MVGFTAIQIYDHILSIFLLPRYFACDITKTRDNLKIAYNPNEIVQIYYKHIQVSVSTLTAFNQTVNEEIMRHAFEAFEKHLDLTQACRG